MASGNLDAPVSVRHAIVERSYEKRRVRIVPAGIRLLVDGWLADVSHVKLLPVGRQRVVGRCQEDVVCAIRTHRGGRLLQLGQQGADVDERLRFQWIPSADNQRHYVTRFDVDRLSGLRL